MCSKRVRLLRQYQNEIVKARHVKQYELAIRHKLINAMNATSERELDTLSNETHSLRNGMKDM